jgi:hypothetical protein
VMRVAQFTVDSSQFTVRNPTAAAVSRVPADSGVAMWRTAVPCPLASPTSTKQCRFCVTDATD